MIQTVSASCAIKTLNCLLVGERGHDPRALFKSCKTYSHCTLVRSSIHSIRIELGSQVQQDQYTTLCDLAVQFRLHSFIPPLSKLFHTVN
jgi:hypothetical protein